MQKQEPVRSESNVARKTDVCNRKVSWLDTHEILIEKNQPGFIKMRPKIEGAFQIVDLNKAGYELDLKHMVLGSLWPAGRPMSKEKIKDLQKMMDLVPPEHQNFYLERMMNRVQQVDFDEDIDGFGQTIDFLVEEQDFN